MKDKFLDQKVLLGILLIGAAVISVSSMTIHYVRYFSFTKYNVQPLEECDRYLKETYYGNFTGELVDFYRKDGYYIWKFRYTDETGLEFYEYYRHPQEVSEGGMYLFYASDRGMLGVYDHYWQKKLQEVYEEDFQMKQYESDWDLSIVKYIFRIEEMSDIENIADIITTTLIYTKENTRKMSLDIIGYSVYYREKSVYGVFLDEEMQKLLEQERDEIFDYIYDEISNACKKEMEK